MLQGFASASLRGSRRGACRGLAPPDPTVTKRSWGGRAGGRGGSCRHPHLSSHPCDTTVHPTTSIPLRGKVGRGKEAGDRQPAVCPAVAIGARPTTALHARGRIPDGSDFPSCSSGPAAPTPPKGSGGQLPAGPGNPEHPRQRLSPVGPARAFTLIIGFKNEKGCLRAPVHQRQRGKIPAVLKIVLRRQPPTEAPSCSWLHPTAPSHREVGEHESTRLAPQKINREPEKYLCSTAEAIPMMLGEEELGNKKKKGRRAHKTSSSLPSSGVCEEQRKAAVKWGKLLQRCCGARAGFCHGVPGARSH